MAIGTINKTVTQINNLLDEVENMSSTYATQADVAQDIATATTDMATQTQVAADIATATNDMATQTQVAQDIATAIAPLATQSGLAEAVEPLAAKDGNYPQMSVGFADNIVGDGTATEEEFSFRPTAGVNRNVETTTYDYDMRSNFGARIESVKGNSVVWNQVAKVRTFTTTRNGISVTSDGVKCTIVGTAEANTNISIATATIPANHKCLLGGCPSNGSASTFYFSDGFNNIDYGQGVIFTTTEAHSDTWMNFTIAQGTTVDFVIHPVLYDLTQMFGAGNEPTTVEEFYTRLPIGVDLTAYNEGEMVDANYKAIKTTGFNQYNGTYAKVVGGCPYYLGSGVSSAGFTTEEGGITEAIVIPTNRLYTPSQNGYIYAEGSDICINIAWDEYSALNGTYAPYKPFERDLSWISQYYPEGMRRAGSVCDEIRFNSTTQQWEAVPRVGAVDLGSLTWNVFDSASNIYIATIADIKTPPTNGDRNKGILCNKYIPSPTTGLNSLMLDGGMLRYDGNIVVRDSNYATAGEMQAAMQGIMLNYELATPLVAEIEEIPNLDYDVADYGTEELIVAEGVKSAPFLGDIIYTPNALKTLEQIPDILRRLTALENA